MDALVDGIGNAFSFLFKKQWRLISSGGDCCDALVRYQRVRTNSELDRPCAVH